MIIRSKNQNCLKTIQFEWVENLSDITTRKTLLITCVSKRCQVLWLINFCDNRKIVLKKKNCMLFYFKIII